MKNNILYSIIRTFFNKYENYLTKNNPILLMKYRYWKNMGVRLNLKNPKTLDEKINYMSFYTDTREWSKLADKVQVREYIKNCGFSDILNEIYGVYNSVDEIDFNSLPKMFVIKTNHASATNIFIKNKDEIDIEHIKNKINEWLKIDYGLLTATPHYSRINPKIIIEKYLIENNDINKSLTDYKIYCFNGIPKYIFVFSERVANSHEFKKMIYDTSWIPHPEYINKGLIHGEIIKEPKSLKEMLHIASVLSKPFPFVRVDLYNIDGRIIFSELTFTPGHNSAANYKLLEIMGNLIRMN